MGPHPNLVCLQSHSMRRHILIWPKRYEMQYFCGAVHSAMFVRREQDVVFSGLPRLEGQMRDVGFGMTCQQQIGMSEFVFP